MSELSVCLSEHFLDWHFRELFLGEILVISGTFDVLVTHKLVILKIISLPSLILVSCYLSYLEPFGNLVTSLTI